MAYCETRADGFAFHDLAGSADWPDWAETVTAFTNWPAERLRHLFFGHSRSRAFVITNQGRIVGFQAFVYKPVLYDGTYCAAFRSEGTQTLAELRGTGLFPQFYTWAMARIRADYPRVYFWGLTYHRAWRNFGFRMPRGMMFFQVLGAIPEGAKSHRFVYDRPILRLAARVTSPLLWLLRPWWGGAVEMVEDLSFERFRQYRAGALAGRMQLHFDAEDYAWRYGANPFEVHTFVHDGSGLVIGVADGESFRIGEILCPSVGGYLRLLAHITRRYGQVIYQGNVLTEARLPWFWVHALLGAVLIPGRGGYVEYNLDAPEISWRDNPLTDSWAFATYFG